MRRELNWKSITQAALLLFPLIGLTIRRDWDGVAMALAVVPLVLLPAISHWPPQHRWRWFARTIFVASLVWGVEIVGIFAVLDGEDFQPSDALFAAGLFGALTAVVGGSMR